MAALGRELRAWRTDRGLALEHVAAQIGISRSRLAELEAGDGDRAPLAAWVAVGLLMRRPLAVAFSREVEAGPKDAGHLAIQELVLARARAHGITRSFELATKTLRSIDVCLIVERHATLVVTEIWNRLDDVGAAKRDTNRKVAEAAELAAARGGPILRVASCWVVRATAANRALVARFPNVFETAFPGSSRAWVRALSDGEEPPHEPGLVWADVAGTRLFEWRRRG